MKNCKITSKMIKQILLLCFTLMFALGHAAPVSSTEENFFVALNGNNFEQMIKSHKFVLVHFYNPSLPCFAPLYDTMTAAEMFSRKTGSNIFLAQVNGYVESDLAQKYHFDLQNCPAGMQFFHNGEPDGFMNESSIGKIAAWLMQKHGKSAIRISSAQEAKQFSLSDDLVVLGLFKDIKSKAAKEFLAADQQMALVPFGISNSVELFQEYDVAGDSAVLVLRKFDDPVVVYSGEMKFESIVDFVKSESLPLVIDLTNARYLGSVLNLEKKGILFLLTGQSDAANITEAARKAAKRFQGNVQFVILDTDSNPQAGYVFCRLLGVDPAHLPAIRYRDSHDQSATPAVYKPSQDAPEFITAENIKLFVQDALAGKLEPLKINPFSKQHK